jgi:hypothetical protein
MNLPEAIRRFHMWMLRRLLPPQWMPEPVTPEEMAAAAEARAGAEQDLRATRRQWKDVERAHDDLANRIQRAMGRRR